MLPNNILERVFRFQLPRRIIFGTKTSEKVGDEAKDLGAENALLITDETIRKLGIANTIQQSLEKRNLKVDIFSNIKAEPSLEVADSVAGFVRNGNFDIVIGCGGGSVLDMAKVAAMAATNPNSMGQYLGVNQVKNPTLPKILLPTTAGTGSEVTNIAIVTLVADEIKTAIVSPHMLGDIAIVDPILTYNLPPRITASTGLDALSHSIETLMSVDANPITDSLALQAVRLIFLNLPEAYSNGESARRNGMSLGSLTSGMAFGNAGVCIGHAAAYSFAATYHIPHGVSCALTLPHVFKFNALAIPHKLTRIADAIGIDVKKLKPEETANAISDAIFALMKEVDMPTRLRDIGVPKEALPKMVDRLLATERLVRKNPKALTNENASELFEEMW